MNVGIIGAGTIAKRMAKTLNALKDFNAYAIASRNIDKANKFAKKYHFDKAYGNYEEMLKDEKVELVYIATPHAFHYEQMLLCLKYNKPVICEKSFTTSLLDTIDIYKKFEEKKLFVTEALWTNYLPSMQVIKDLIYKQNIIGDIKKIDSYFIAPLKHKERIIKKELGGGVILDVGIYTINFLLAILGDNYKNYEVLSKKMINDIEIKLDLKINYENAIGIAHNDGTKFGSMKAKIVGEKGKIVIDNVTCPNYIFIYQGILLKKVIHFKKITGFEYQLYECKNAIEKKEVEAKSWTHKQSIEIAKIMEELIN